MRDNFYEEIVFSLEAYNENQDVMWIDISKLLQVLCRAGYIAKIYADNGSEDIIVVQFHYQDENLASGTCDWVTWDEYNALADLRERSEIVVDRTNS